jgi:multidrug transporter EmrE-like cation transporter
MNNIDNIKWAFLSSIVSCLYFFLIKEYIRSKKTHIISLVIALQLLIIYLYYQSLQKIKSGIVYAIINGLSVILGIIVANMYFKETFTRNDLLGILLIVIGIVIVGK